MESFSVLIYSFEDEDNDEDNDEDEDDDDDIELSLERMEQSTEDEDEEDDESNILSTNMDSPSNSLVIELWSCCHSSVVLHLQRDIFCLDGGRCCCCHKCFFNYMNTIEFFHPKNKHSLKKTVHAGWNFIRKYSYLKIKFCLYISKIISMQEPTTMQNDGCETLTYNMNQKDQTFVDLATV